MNVAVDICYDKSYGRVIPFTDGTRWFALVRQWSPWLAPRHGKTQFSLDSDAILCALQAPHGRYLVFLAVSGINDTVSVLRSTSDGNLSAHV